MEYLGLSWVTIKPFDFLKYHSLYKLEVFRKKVGKPLFVLLDSGWEAFYHESEDFLCTWTPLSWLKKGWSVEAEESD